MPAKFQLNLSSLHSGAGTMNNRRRSNTEEEEEEGSTLIPKLPDELALQCLARVPKPYHRTLPVLSKPIRSAVASPRFAALRSDLGISDSDEVLIIQVRAPFQASAMWFSLSLATMRQQPLPPLPVPKLYESTSVAFRSTIYVFGGRTNDPTDGPMLTTLAVWLLDCRSNTWSPGPPMGVPRSRAHAVVLDGRIYLIGGADEGDAFGEVLDVSLGRWEPIPEPPVKRSMFLLCAVQAHGGVIRLWGLTEQLRFDPATWEWAEPTPFACRGSEPWCAFKGAIYTYGEGTIKWLDLDESSQEFKAVEGGKQALPRHCWLGPKLANAGGHKLVVMAGSGASWSLRWRAIPSIRSNRRLWRSVIRDPFEVRIAEMKVSEDEENGRAGRVVWSKKVLSLLWPDPPQGSPYPYVDDYVHFYDWNVFQVSQ